VQRLRAKKDPRAPGAYECRSRRLFFLGS